MSTQQGSQGKAVPPRVTVLDCVQSSWVREGCAVSPSPITVSLHTRPGCWEAWRWVAWESGVAEPSGGVWASWVSLGKDSGHRGESVDNQVVIHSVLHSHL